MDLKSISGVWISHFLLSFGNPNRKFFSDVAPCDFKFEKKFLFFVVLRCREIGIF